MIRFEHVTKVYRDQTRPALDDVSVEVEKGEFVFLVGTSGSGKSTFLRLVLQGGTPTTGQVYVLGKDARRALELEGPALRRQIGTVFQDFRLLPNKTVAENVAFALEVIGKPRPRSSAVVPEVLELVGPGRQGETASPTSSPVVSSSAWRSPARSSTARCSCIADEPTGNLDPQTSVGIMKLLDRINRTGTTVVMATHDAAIVDQMRKRVIELEDGHVVRDQSRGVYGYAR